MAKIDINELIDVNELDSGLIRVLRQFISKLNIETYDSQSCVPISRDINYIFDKRSSILRVRGSEGEVIFKVFSNHITKVEYDSRNNSYVLKNADILYKFALDERNATLVPASPVEYVYCAFLNAMPISYPKTASIIQMNIPPNSRFNFVNGIGGFKLNLVISKDILFIKDYYIRDPIKEPVIEKKGLFEALGTEPIYNAYFRYSFSYHTVYY